MEATTLTAHSQPAPQLSSLSLPVSASAADQKQLNITPLLSSLSQQKTATAVSVAGQKQSSIAPQLSSLSLPVHKTNTPASTAGQKQSSIWSETLKAELKGVSAKWHKLGSQLKIDFVQLDYIRKVNSNDSEKCLSGVLETLISGKTSSPWKKLCKALESDIIGEKSLSEHLKRKYGATNVKIVQKGECMQLQIPRVASKVHMG